LMPGCANKVLIHPRLLFDARGGEGGLIIVTAHVDDQLIHCIEQLRALDKFKLQLNSEFECKDMGPAQHWDLIYTEINLIASYTSPRRSI
jgi:hypothetical protein